MVNEKREDCPRGASTVVQVPNLLELSDSEIGELFYFLDDQNNPFDRVTYVIGIDLPKDISWNDGSHNDDKNMIKLSKQIRTTLFQQHPGLGDLADPLWGRLAKVILPIIPP